MPVIHRDRSIPQWLAEYNDWLEVIQPFERATVGHPKHITCPRLEENATSPSAHQWAHTWIASADTLMNKPLRN